MTSEMVTMILAVVACLGGGFAFVFKLLNNKVDKQELEDVVEAGFDLLRQQISSTVEVTNVKFDNITKSIDNLSESHRRHSKKVSDALGKAEQALRQQIMIENDIERLRDRIDV